MIIASNKLPISEMSTAELFLKLSEIGSINADKEKSTEKIDSAIETIIELDRGIRFGGDAGRSAYDYKGIGVLY